MSLVFPLFSALSSYAEHSEVSQWFYLLVFLRISATPRTILRTDQDLNFPCLRVFKMLSSFLVSLGKEIFLVDGKFFGSFVVSLAFLSFLPYHRVFKVAIQNIFQPTLKVAFMKLSVFLIMCHFNSLRKEEEKAKFYGD